jgi:hypothetical protein
MLNTSRPVVGCRPSRNSWPAPPQALGPPVVPSNGKTAEVRIDQGRILVPLILRVAEQADDAAERAHREDGNQGQEDDDHTAGHSDLVALEPRPGDATE